MEFSKPDIKSHEWFEILQEENTFNVPVRAAAIVFVIIKKNSTTVDFKAASRRNKQRMLHVILVHRGS